MQGSDFIKRFRTAPIVLGAIAPLFLWSGFFAEIVALTNEVRGTMGAVSRLALELFLPLRVLYLSPLFIALGVFAFSRAWTNARRGASTTYLLAASSLFVVCCDLAVYLVMSAYVVYRTPFLHEAFGSLLL